jgi:hypothetical protein
VLFGKGDVWAGISLVNSDAALGMADVGPSADNKEEVILLFTLYLNILGTDDSVRTGYYCRLEEQFKGHARTSCAKKLLEHCIQVCCSAWASSDSSHEHGLNATHSTDSIGFNLYLHRCDIDQEECRRSQRKCYHKHASLVLLKIIYIYIYILKP